VRQLQAAGAIQITASHNPAPWNGLKLFGANGGVLTAVEGRQVQTLFESDSFRRASHAELGHVADCHQADEWHLQRVLQRIDVPLIRARGLSVFLDANAGAGGPLGQALLKALQCRATMHGGVADGFFLHEPEPTAENLKEICPLVPRAGADIGFVLDPDSDRLAIIDETGRYIGEELTLALAVLFRLEQQRGPVVINMSTSRLVEDIAQKFGIMALRSAVGEANVVDKMKQVDAVIGGEGNGGVIDPRIGIVRDPFIGMGMVLNLLAKTQKKVSTLVAELPAYHIVKDKFPLDKEKLPSVLAALQGRWPEAMVNLLDGVRLDWADHWVHVRPSNTEPIVRVIAEAPRAEDASRLCAEVGALLR
jgi:phosphomannomutase